MRMPLGKTVKHLHRYRHIMAVLLKYGFNDLAEKISLRFTLRMRGRPGPLALEAARPLRLRLALEELGPTFVKLGQLLSTRPDLLPPPYIDELSKLQDNVAPADFEKVRREIERELKGKLEDNFSDFNPVPIAAGSIAQVHRATTRQGRPVAVKARRPGIVEVLQTECEILESLAAVAKSGLAPGETIDPVQMVREFTSAVMKEVDLTNELRNLQRFEKNFASDPAVHIPATYERLSTSGVLTMEFIDGIRSGDVPALKAAGLDPKLIAQRGADFVLKQVFDFGLFHTDPHPGNFLILPGNVLAPLDFGQVARLDATDRYLMAELVLAIVDNDAPRLVRAFRRCDLLSYRTNVRELTAQMEEILDNYHSLPLEQVRLGRMMVQTFELIRRHHVRPPPEFTMMLKSIMTIESLALRLDPEFRIIDHLRPYARRLGLEQISPQRVWRDTRRLFRESLELASRLPDDLNMFLNKTAAGQFQLHVQHEHLESLIHSITRSSNRISFALVIAGIVVGSSLLVTQEQGTVLGIMSIQTLGTFGYIIAGLMGLWLIVSIVRSKHI